MGQLVIQFALFHLFVCEMLSMPGEPNHIEYFWCAYRNRKDNGGVFAEFFKYTLGSYVVRTLNKRNNRILHFSSPPGAWTDCTSASCEQPKWSPLFHWFFQADGCEEIQLKSFFSRPRTTHDRRGNFQFNFVSVAQTHMCSHKQIVNHYFCIDSVWQSERSLTKSNFKIGINWMGKHSESGAHAHKQQCSGVAAVFVP